MNDKRKLGKWVKVNVGMTTNVVEKPPMSKHVQLAPELKVLTVKDLEDFAAKTA